MDHITVKQIVNVLIALGSVFGALGTVGGVLYVMVFRPFRRFLRNEIVSGLTEINTTLTRTEERLIAHITNPVAHQAGEYHENRPKTSSAGH